MRCPICDNKAPNCDCTRAEREQYNEIEQLESDCNMLWSENRRLQTQLTIAQRHRDTYREIVKHWKKERRWLNSIHEAMSENSTAHLLENQRLKERFAEIGLRATVAEDENRRLREGLEKIRSYIISDAATNGGALAMTADLLNDGEALGGGDNGN